MDLTLDFHRFYNKGFDGWSQAAGAFCSCLWKALPSVRALELVWPAEVALLQHITPLPPGINLTSLALRAKWEGYGGNKEGKEMPEGEAAALAGLLFSLSRGSRSFANNLVLDLGLGQQSWQLVAESLQGLMAQLQAVGMAQLMGLAQLQVSALGLGT
jgi:hypothetical protein